MKSPVVLKGSMRFALVRGWAVAATALLAAAVADAGTEFAQNSGWLGGAMRDNQHESVLPTLLAGAAIALSLVLFVLFSRISPRDPLLLRMSDFGARSLDIAIAFGGSVACVVAMEGYETRFGGVSPFDPRSVVMSHAVASIVAFAVIGSIVYCVLRSAVRRASRASGAVIAFLAEFLRKLAATVAAPQAEATSAYQLHLAHVPPGLAGGACGFRAPPRAIRLHNLTL